MTKRDLTGLEAAEMRFLRSVKGYTRLDKIRNEVIRKEIDNTRLPKHALKYKPRGRRNRGRPKKRWQCVDAGAEPLH